MARHIHRVELSAFVDGELSPERAARVARHLEECPRCLEEARALAEVVALLRASRRPTAPPTLKAAVARRLSAERALLWPGEAASEVRRDQAEERSRRRGVVIPLRGRPAEQLAGEAGHRVDGLLAGGSASLCPPRRRALWRWVPAGASAGRLAVGALVGLALALGLAWTAGSLRQGWQSTPSIQAQDNLDFFVRDHSRYVDVRQASVDAGVLAAAGWR